MYFLRKKEKCKRGINTKSTFSSPPTTITETALYVIFYRLPAILFIAKKGIPYSQALRLDWICSNNEFFDKICNGLEKYLLERGYSEKIVHKEILWARAILRDALLQKVNNQEKLNKTTFSITNHPVFRDVRKILEELHVVLAFDDGHKKLFPNVLMIGFKINKNLRAHFVRSQLPD